MPENKVEVDNIRKVFLNELPRRKNGRIDWISSEGYIISFIYYDIIGTLEIIKYIGKNDIIVKYNNEESILKIARLKNCNLGKLLNKRTSEFKIEVGTTFKDDKRDITIIDREYRIDKKERKLKLYKYKCNKCGYEGWMIEGDLKRGNGCPVCGIFGKKAVLGKNTIWDTDKWMIPYVGEEFAKTHTHSCSDKIYPTCPICGRKKSTKVLISNIYKRHSISCSCSDKVPYPEKFMYSVFEQLRLNFQTQLSKTTFEWCDKYYYDFYLNDYNILTEVNGEQHYKQTNRKRARNYEEEVKNDKLKKKLALNNGILEKNYIEINCSRSELEWIKNSILESNLSKIFDLSNIDWLKCEEFALSSRVKEACEYKKNNPEMTTNDIGILMKLSKDTICKYLKQGSKIWDLINYNAKEEHSKCGSRTGKASGKQVEIFKEGVSLGIFPSATELERQSEKLFGVKLLHGNISSVCLGNRKQHQGFIFKYVEQTKITF